MTISRTAHLKLPIPDFLTSPWHSELEDSIRSIDEAIYEALITQDVTAWANSTDYEVGDFVLDIVDGGGLWIVDVEHTSAASPTTFAQDRTANPTYWRQLVTMPDQRGEWQTGETYIKGDFVLDNGRYAICQISHVAGTFNTDLAAGRWEVLVDVSSITGALTPLLLDTTFYVRTDGDDGNDGLTNSAGGAFLTWQAAFNHIVSTYQFNGKNVTIQAGGTGSRTFSNGAGGIITIGDWIGGGTLSLLGDATTPANVVLSSTSADCIKLSNHVTGVVTINGFDIRTTTSGYGVNNASVGQINIGQAVVFGACATGYIASTNKAARVLSVASGGNCFSINGDTVTGLYAESGTIDLVAGTYTVSGTRALTRFAHASKLGLISSLATWNVTGSVTGARYLAEGTSLISTSGDETHFPGNTAGSQTSGGTYKGSSATTNFTGVTSFIATEQALFDAATGSPVISFDGDTNTGIGRTAADAIGIYVGGTARLIVSGASGVSISGVASATALTVSATGSAHGIVGNANTAGVYGVNGTTSHATGGGVIGISGNPSVFGILGYQSVYGCYSSGVIQASEQIRGPFGVVGAPTYSFASDQNSGVYGVGADDVGISAGGSLVARWQGTTSAFMQAVFDDTVASAANVNVASNGRLRLSTSSIEFKKNVEEMDREAAYKIVLGAEAKWYRSTSKGDYSDWSWYGFIAEDVAKKLDPRLVHWTDEYKKDEDGNFILDKKTKLPIVKKRASKANGVMYDRFVPPICLVIQDLHADVAAIKQHLGLSVSHIAPKRKAVRRKK